MLRRSQATVKTHPEINPQNLRDALRFWATGVTIVAAVEGDERHGMTVNSFTSVSLEPPLVMVSLERGTRTHALVSRSGAFAVSVLPQALEAISNRFAGRETEESDRFAGVETFTQETGSPILEDAIAYFDCLVNSAHSAGTHTLFIGEVVVTGLTEDQAPLLYYNRAYRRLAE
jgi:flavin reductase (DIM6/NTAB) family NADH-FMN oxidoreductase RutF